MSDVLRQLNNHDEQFRREIIASFRWRVISLACLSMVVIGTVFSFWRIHETSRLIEDIDTHLRQQDESIETMHAEHARLIDLIQQPN